MMLLWKQFDQRHEAIETERFKRVKKLHPETKKRTSTEEQWLARVYTATWLAEKVAEASPHVEVPETVKTRLARARFAGVTPLDALLLASVLGLDPVLVATLYFADTAGAAAAAAPDIRSSQRASLEKTAKELANQADYLNRYASSGQNWRLGLRYLRKHLGCELHDAEFIKHLGRAVGARRGEESLKGQEQVALIRDYESGNRSPTGADLDMSFASLGHFVSGDEEQIRIWVRAIVTFSERASVEAAEATRGSWERKKLATVVEELKLTYRLRDDPKAAATAAAGAGESLEMKALAVAVEELKGAHRLHDTWDREDIEAAHPSPKAGRPSFRVYKAAGCELTYEVTRTIYGGLVVERLEAVQPKKTSSPIRIVNALHDGIEIAVLLEGKVRLTTRAEAFPEEALVLEQPPRFDLDEHVKSDAVYEARRNCVVIFQSGYWHRVEVLSPRAVVVSINLNRNVMLPRSGAPVPKQGRRLREAAAKKKSPDVPETGTPRAPPRKRSGET